jgi:hypothetical protein
LESWNIALLGWNRRLSKDYEYCGNGCGVGRDSAKSLLAVKAGFTDGSAPAGEEAVGRPPEVILLADG